MKNESKRESYEFSFNFVFRIIVTTERYNKAKEDLNRLKREMASTHAGMLFIEKTNLEATLKQLSDEVKENIEV